MNKIDYWTEAVSSSFDEAGIVATKEQIEGIAGDMEVCHDQYNMAFGYDVASANLSGSKDQEIEDLKDELKAEREKITCKECGGRGNITEQGPCHSSTSQCCKCHGEGRV